MKALAELFVYTRCEFAKLKRKPLFLVLAASSVLLPLAFALFLSDPPDSETAVIQSLATMIQLSAYLVLIPAVAVLASHLLFAEQDYDTMKNLACVPVGRGMLAVCKLLVLLLFAVLFMAAGALVTLFLLLCQGWEPAGYWPLFAVCLGQGVLMWAGALPCILLVVLLNKSYILSVIITFFYTMVNYIVPTALPGLTAVPLGFNAGTLIPGALSLRWYTPFLSPGEQPPLVQMILEHAVSTPAAFGISALEAVFWTALIAWAYRRQEA